MAFVNVTKNILPLDTNLYTGPTRMQTETIARTGDVVLDVEHEPAKALYVGVTGNIEVVKLDGTVQIFPNVAAGDWFRTASIQINTAGTTATGLIWGS